MGDSQQVPTSWPKVKKFMFVNRRAPHGTIYALESLEVVLVTAAFDQEVTVVFMDDGVYQLVKGQQTEGIGTKNFSPAYRALEDYDVHKLLVDRDSMDLRKVREEDFLIPVEVVDSHRIGLLMQEQDVILSF